jgi:hypothetical protein
MNRVKKRSDRGRPVVNSNMRSMSGALINHCIYRTQKMLRVGDLTLNSVLTDVCPKLDAMAKYAIDDTVRITTAI